MDVDTVRLLKTQDLGYVRTMRQVAMKEVARLEEQVILSKGFDHLDDEDEEEDEDDDDDDFNFATPIQPKPARKIVFMEDDEERDEVIRDQEEQDDEDDSEDEFKGFDDDEKKGEAFERAKALRRIRRQLEHARRKLKGLTDVELELEVQRAKMAKTATSGGQTKKGKKIMVRTRKR